MIEEMLMFSFGIAMGWFARTILGDFFNGD